MMSDILRVSRQPTFRNFFDALSVHLVEVSDTMKHLQRNNLNTLHCTTTDRHMLPDSDVEVMWHTDVKDVPTGVPTIYLAHEFFDALPVHLFQRSEVRIKTMLKTGTNKANISPTALANIVGSVCARFKTLFLFILVWCLCSPLLCSAHIITRSIFYLRKFVLSSHLFYWTTLKNL